MITVLPSDLIGGLPGLGSVWDFGAVIAYAIAFSASWGNMNVTAIVLEHRVLIPRQQYISFYYGDPLGLSVMIACLALMVSTLPERSMWYQGLWWHLLWLIVFLGIGVFLMKSEYEAKAYSRAAILSPTKLMHNLVIFPLLGYWVVSAVPALAYSDRGFRGVMSGNLAAIITVAVFLASFGLWIYTIQHDVRGTHGANQDEFVASKQAHVPVGSRVVITGVVTAVLYAFSVFLAVSEHWLPDGSAIGAVGIFVAALVFYGWTVLHDSEVPPIDKPWAGARSMHLARVHKVFLGPTALPLLDSRTTGTTLGAIPHLSNSHTAVSAHNSECEAAVLHLKT